VTFEISPASEMINAVEAARKSYSLYSQRYGQFIQLNVRLSPIGKTWLTNVFTMLKT